MKATGSYSALAENHYQLSPVISNGVIVAASFVRRFGIFSKDCYPYCPRTSQKATLRDREIAQKLLISFAASPPFSRSLIANHMYWRCCGLRRSLSEPPGKLDLGTWWVL